MDGVRQRDLQPTPHNKPPTTIPPPQTPHTRTHMYIIYTGNAAALRARIHRLMTTGEVAASDPDAGVDAAAGEEEDEDGATEANVRAEEEAEAAAMEAGGLGLGVGVVGKGKKKIEHVVIDACAMRVLDLTALASLADVVEEAAESEVYVCMTNLSHAARRLLEGCGLLEQFGGELVTLSVEEVYGRILAMRAAEAEAAAGKGVVGKGMGEGEDGEFKDAEAGDEEEEDEDDGLFSVVDVDGDVDTAPAAAAGEAFRRRLTRTLTTGVGVGASSRALLAGGAGGLAAGGRRA